MSLSWSRTPLVAYDMQVLYSPRAIVEKDAHYEKDTNSSKCHFPRRKYLSYTYESAGLGQVHVLRLTRLARSSRAVEKV